MKDQDLSAVPAHIGKTKEQLINELAETYRRIAELERLETQHKRAEEELRKHREHLEELVKERAAELTAANEQLQQEITERKRTEEALGKTVQEKRAILDSMSEFVVYQDKETRILWANKAAGESVGLTPEQLVGRHCYEIWHKRSKPCKDCPVIKAWKTGQTHQAERITPDGSVGFVRAYPLQDGNGKVLGIVEVVLDITQRKQAEQTLRQSEEKYRDLVERMTDVIYTLDKAGNVTSVNKAVKNLLGFKPEQVIGRIFTRWIPKEVLPQAMADFKQVLKGEEITSETILVDKDGNPYNVEFSSTPIIEDGKVVGTRGIIRDITQRKQAEEALRESEERFRGMIASAQDGIIMMDNEGNISYWNKAAQRIFGYTKKEAMGKEVHIFLGSKRYHEAYRKGFSRFKETGKGPVVGKTLELSAIRKDGSEFPIELSVSAVKVKGKRHAIGIVRDITQRKRAEEALKESESKLRKQKMALEQKNIALREIIAQIEIGKNKIKEDIATNVNELLLPILAKLKIKEVSSKYVDLIKHHLQELVSPFGRKITKKNVRLTLREIEICTLIKGGLTSKETAKLLSLSYKTVEKHRKNIRRKLRIANKNVNLASFLKTL